MRHAGNFNPEWGYLAPAPSFLRTARIVVVASVIGATAGAAVVFSLVDRPAAEESVAAPKNLNASLSRRLSLPHRRRSRRSAYPPRRGCKRKSCKLRRSCRSTHRARREVSPRSCAQQTPMRGLLQRANPAPFQPPSIRRVSQRWLKLRRRRTLRRLRPPLRRSQGPTERRHKRKLPRSPATLGAALRAASRGLEVL